MKNLRLFNNVDEIESKIDEIEKPWIIVDKETNKVYYSILYNKDTLFAAITTYGYKIDDSMPYFEYSGEKMYNDKTYYKFSAIIQQDEDVMVEIGFLSPTRNFNEILYPFNDFHIFSGIVGGECNYLDLDDYDGIFSVKGFYEKPENMIIIDKQPSNRDSNGNDYVDLGLTSGTLWATQNVGATSVTDFGKYFYWGNTQPYDLDENIKSNKLNDKHFDGINDNYKKYNDTDGKLFLDVEDDCVNVIMGGDWRIPTPAQIYELINETTIVKHENYNNSGVACIEFKSKTNDNSLVLPYSGDICDDGYDSDFIEIMSNYIVPIKDDNIYTFLNSIDDAVDVQELSCCVRSYLHTFRGVL